MPLTKYHISIVNCFDDIERLIIPPTTRQNKNDQVSELSINIQYLRLRAETISMYISSKGFGFLLCCCISRISFVNFLRLRSSRCLAMAGSSFLVRFTNTELQGLGLGLDLFSLALLTFATVLHEYCAVADSSQPNDSIDLRLVGSSCNQLSNHSCFLDKSWGRGTMENIEKPGV